MEHWDGEYTRKMIVKFIIRYINEHGYSPSMQEIGEGIGIKARSCICRNIRILIQIGELETDAKEGTPRAIRVPGYKFVKVDKDGNNI